VGWENKKLEKMPWITKSLLMSILPENTGPYRWDEDAIDVTYNMAIDELGFDKSMVNRGNIVKMVMNEWKNAGFPMSLKNTPEEFLDIGRKAEHAYLGRPDTLSGPSLTDYAKKYDKKYDIYSDEGLNILEELIKKDFLNVENIRDLYFNKYQDKYKNNKEKPNG
jgi:hypothetical protein